ncbi:ImmA/IrrE family metallo-endopeptidase [Bacillus sp. REN10]|uniref:ImmA/IrrE family metallo-endopeptidase n=1 Tax=Bacillus sp. REN10 TaxID=2782541 RepID=UPI00193B3108|nr:ImmA/IrrE family metallo-endopeptidase [Bacillus sp. REN10]
MQLSEFLLISDGWEERANKVLSRFSYKSPDEIDIEEICWRYGIIIKPLHPDFMDNYDAIEGLKAYSYPKDERVRGIIHLRPNLPTVERKLVLSEEFCHIHAHISAQLSKQQLMLNKEESQAKKMSAYLLMPHHFLMDVIRSAADEMVLVSDIADHFLVTEEFAHYRLELLFNRRIDAFLTLGNKLGSYTRYE